MWFASRKDRTRIVRTFMQFDLFDTVITSLLNARYVIYQRSHLPFVTASNGNVELVDFHKLFGWGLSESAPSSSEPVGYSKDGKTAPLPPAPAPSSGSPF
jgi:hypothetical protein